MIHSLVSNKKIYLILLLIISVSQNAFASSKKIWEMETQVVEEVGNLQLQMQSAFNRQEPTMFQVGVYSRDPGRNMNAQFRDVCSEYITIVVHAGDLRQPSIQRYKETLSSKDLPIKDLLDLTIKNISDQCDGLPKVARVEFGSIYDRKNKFAYQGTMQKSKGWKLEDGIVQTKFDQNRIFDMTSRDFFSTVGVKYKGSCQDNPILPLAPMYSNMTEKAFAEPPSWGNYLIFAKKVSQTYAHHCPETTLIKYSIDPVPDEYECAKEEGCYLTSAKSNDWETERSQYVIKEPEVSPVPDLVAMANKLANKEYDILHDYQNFFAFFFESFTMIYSDHCRSHIDNPKGRKIYTIEEKVDEFGFRSDAEIIGEPREVYIADAYEEAFDWYYGSYKMWAVNKYMSTILTYQKKGKSPSFAVGMAMGFFTRNYNELENYVSGNCTEDHIQAAYRNMLEYAYKDKPLDPQTEKMVEDIKMVTDWIEDGLGTRESREATRAANAEKARKVYEGGPKVKVESKSKKKPSQQVIKQADPSDPVGEGPYKDLSTGWVSEIDGKKVEAVFWPKPTNAVQMDGYVYVPVHDCLMQAQFFKYQDTYAFTFNSAGIYQRENNCTLDTAGPKFHADGFARVDGLPNAFIVEWPFLIFNGRSLISDENKKPSFTFKRSAISPQLHEIVSNYKHKFMPLAPTQFVSQLKISKESPKKASIEEYKTTASGLQYAILKEGEGVFPNATDTVTVHYRGTLEDGTEFDSSYKRGQPLSFSLAYVIKGWTEGLQLVKPNGRIKLVIPAELGYGSQASGPIPAGATLYFDIELLSIK